MPSRKNSPKKKSFGPVKGGRVRLWLVAVGILILSLLVSALVFLAHRWEIRMPEKGAPPVEQAPAKRKQPRGEPQTKRPERRPQVAIVMDDLGRSIDFGKALLEIDLPVTFAILPGEAHATALAEMAHRHGREVLIHLPLEPQGFPLVDPGPDAIFLTMGAVEIRQRLEDFRRLVPHAVGGNNHMGSRFTEDREGMRALLAAMKEADLFFLDSLTSGQSVARAEALQARIPAAVRDLFLDNVQEVEKIEGEIRQLVHIAQRRGQAVGICHPYPQTLEALRHTAGELRRAGVELVPVAQVLVR